LRKRILIPLLALLLLLLIPTVLVIRGNWADSELKNPSLSSEGVVKQVYLNEDGRKIVRCAVVIDHPTAEVWRVVTDYENFHRFLPYAGDVRVVGGDQEADTLRLEGATRSSLWGTWRFTANVKHEEHPNPDEYRTSWDEAGEDLTVNRGSWVLQPVGKMGSHTLLVYTLDVEAKRYPTFAVRTVIYDRIGRVVDAVREEVERRARHEDENGQNKVEHP